ncbi:MAG TPA: lanthionine synthetase LanC family protein, partial [Micromonosporaceae bacterium]|nr:lanthionine synthetase LanC family protein [Micromonosporaceae bacterium]
LRRYGGGELLHDVLGYLVRLTQPRGHGLPGWWALDGPTGPGLGWEGGHGNLGMAHGIAGPLALLALAMRRGIVVDGQAEAMRRICAWLDQFRGGTSPRNWWPETLTRAHHDHWHIPKGGPYRPSWCYGTPGIAYSQRLAGLALNDKQRQRLALDTLVWCVTDNTQLARLSDVSLCHGWAGLLYIAWRAGSHDDRIRVALPRLLDGLTTALHQTPRERGLLLGETGALLTQRAVTVDTPPVTQWDVCFLLND